MGLALGKASGHWLSWRPGTELPVLNAERVSKGGRGAVEGLPAFLGRLLSLCHSPLSDSPPPLRFWSP